MFEDLFSSGRLWRTGMIGSFRGDRRVTLAGFVFGGGLAFWLGLIANRPAISGVGAGALAVAFGLMMVEGGVEWPAVPLLALTALLAVGIKRGWLGSWQGTAGEFESGEYPPSRKEGVKSASVSRQWAGWVVFVAVVLALGFRALPVFSPVGTVRTLEHLFHFPPEKIVLMLLVPTMVLIPWSARARGRWADRPWTVSLAVFAGISIAVTPPALATGFIAPGFTDKSAPYLVYWLAYNLLYTCVLEESFFRGILQTALIRGWARRFTLSVARALGIGIAAILFGLAHFGGGLVYVVLATIAGVGYGLAYDLTGRLHCAVLVHFAINAVHRLVFAGP
jgi:membrane protease YdiL (CAAX protease family)